jgi:hypothetical protein
MAGAKNSLGMVKRAALPALGFLIIANFLGYAIVGSNGVLSWGDYRRAKAERGIELAQLEEERHAWRTAPCCSTRARRIPTLPTR